MRLRACVRVGGGVDWGSEEGGGGRDTAHLLSPVLGQLLELRGATKGVSHLLDDAGDVDGATPCPHTDHARGAPGGGRQQLVHLQQPSTGSSGRWHAKTYTRNDGVQPHGTKETVLLIWGEREGGGGRRRLLVARNVRGWGWGGGGGARDKDLVRMRSGARRELRAAFVWRAVRVRVGHVRGCWRTLASTPARDVRTTAAKSSTLRATRASEAGPGPAPEGTPDTS